MRDVPNDSDSKTHSGGVSATGERDVPLGDWVRLPLVGMLTIVVLAGSTELIARRMFSVSMAGFERCMVLNDPTTGARGIPNSVCWEKSPENPPIEFRFNRCGHRAGMECGPKPADTFRIVMIGSSVAMGERVQRDESFAALLPVQISQFTGRPVELYNESMGWGFSRSTSLRFNEVLDAQPDMILWTLTPMDVERAALIVPALDDVGAGSGLSLAAKAWERTRTAFAVQSFSGAIAAIFSRTRTALLLRHFLYQSQSHYVKAFLMSSDEEAGYLKSDQGPEWKDRLSEFDRDAAQMEGQARAAGIPFVAVLIPERAQAAMISMGTWPTGFDPYNLDAELRSIIVSHGGVYLDILPEFRTIPNPEQYYFPVDGHPNPAGHAIISAMLARAITSGAILPLKAGDPLKGPNNGK